MEHPLRAPAAVAVGAVVLYTIIGWSFSPSLTLLSAPLLAALLVFAMTQWRRTRLLADHLTQHRATLEDTDAKLKSIFEASPDAVMIADHDGNIVLANDLSLTLFGYDRRELIGRPVEILLPASIREAHKKHRQEFSRRPRKRRMGTGLELQGLHKNGQVFPAEVSLNPIRTHVGPLVSFIVRDVTDRKEAERVHERLSTILESSTDFVGMADGDGRFFYINQAGRRLLGIGGFDESSAFTLKTITTPEGARIIEKQTLPAIHLEGSWTGESELQPDAGPPIPVSQMVIAHRGENGRVEYYSTVARSIATLKDQQQRLRRLNRTYAVLSECNQALVRAADENELLSAFCKNLVSVGSYRFVWVGFCENDPDKTIRPAAHAGHEDGYLQQSRFSWAETETGKGPTGTAVRTGEPVTARDTEADRFFFPWRESARRRGYRSSIALPLIQDEHTYGVLNIYSDTRNAFDNDEVQLLKELAGDLAFGIHTLQTRAAREAAEEMLRIQNRAIEASRNGVLICRSEAPDYPVIYANPASEHITGYPRNELLGRSLESLVTRDTGDAQLEILRYAFEHKQEGHLLLRSRRKDGSDFWSELFLAPVGDENGYVTHFTCILNDVTEHKRYEEQLEYQANHDELTGLPNRNLMHDRLTQAVTLAKRHGDQLGVLFLDVDQFKVVNDSLGHRLGDDLLKQVSQRLSHCVRNEDTLARHGGDEFVILLADLERPEDASRIAQQIFDVLEKPLVLDGQSVTVSLSLGASIFPRDGTDAETLLKNADAAVYRAKELGRNNLQFYTKELNSRAMERLTMENQLRLALQRDELCLYYQPQLDLHTGCITGMEALVRWQHPDLGLISPGQFIPLAEETGLIVPLGDWVLEQACMQNRLWQDEDLPAVAVAVNLSARQLSQAGLQDKIRLALENSGLSSRYLELELTESTLMEEPTEMIEKMQQLKGLGIQLSIDDFGTGYSSLSYLSAFSFDKLKIDKSFVNNMSNSTHDEEIALAIIAMAHSLRLRVIAEGVETEEQFRYLQQNGCDEIQGFYYARPVPADEATELLRGQLSSAVGEG